MQIVLDSQVFSQFLDSQYQVWSNDIIHMNSANYSSDILMIESHLIAFYFITCLEFLYQLMIKS